jgi:hypothetical protein
MELTSAQINEYLSRNAFASVRAAGNSPLTASSLLSKVSTSNMKGTMKLLSGTSERIDTILANLNEMSRVAKAATGNNISSSAKSEAYAKLRSLGAGIDTIVSKTTFDGRPCSTEATCAQQRGRLQPLW